VQEGGVRYARNKDTTQDAIVAAIRAAGWQVYFVGEPCDLFVYKNGVWRAIECKTPRNKKGDPKLDKRRKAQAEFCELTNTPYITSPQMAMDYLGETFSYFGRP
jgi:hypothetical protein